MTEEDTMQMPKTEKEVSQCLDYLIHDLKAHPETVVHLQCIGLLDITVKLYDSIKEKPFIGTEWEKVFKKYREDKGFFYDRDDDPKTQNFYVSLALYLYLSHQLINLRKEEAPND